MGITGKRVEKSGMGGRARTMAGAGPTDLLYWDYLQVGVGVRVLLWGVPFAASESQRPDDLVCRVGDRGRSLRGAAGSAIVVSLCLRAGDGVWISRGWCTCCGRSGAWVGELERWLREPAFACSCGH